MEEEGAGVVVGSEAAPEPMAETTAPKADAPAPLCFNVGDIVIGIATKYKEKYDGQRCEVIAVLSRHYKVKMLTGPAFTEVHKYSKDAVKAVPASEQEARAAGSEESAPEATGDERVEGEAPPQRTRAVGSEGSETQDIAVLFDNIFDH